MGIDDTDFQELLALLPKESIPADPAEARREIENFVNLVELLMRPLPPAGSSTPRQPSSSLREAFPLSSSNLESTSEVQGRDSGIGSERC